MNFLEWLLDYSSYNRRDFCGEGWETNPNLKYIHFYSDLAIGSCYVVVSLALLYVRRKYSNLLYSDGLSFACFISFLYVLFCGIGHYIDCLFFSYPLYNLKGFWSLVTAGVSVIGAYAIVYALLRHLVKYASDIDASNISSFLL